MGPKDLAALPDLEPKDFQLFGTLIQCFAFMDLNLRRALETFHSRAFAVGAKIMGNFRAEAIESGQFALGCDLEHRAARLTKSSGRQFREVGTGPTIGRCPVQITVVALDQRPIRAAAVCALTARTEAVQP